MSTLEKAIEIAARAHAGQKDKSGAPYILHPIRVLLGVQSLDEQIVAVLHDIVEDTDVSFQALKESGFSETVVSAVRALTKQDGESRVEAARRAVQDPVARAVKLADVTDNMDLSRIPNPSDKDHARMKEYEEVRAILIRGE